MGVSTTMAYALCCVWLLCCLVLMGVAELLALPFMGVAEFPVVLFDFDLCCRRRAQTVPVTLFLLLINAVWNLMIFMVFC